MGHRLSFYRSILPRLESIIKGRDEANRVSEAFKAGYKTLGPDPSHKAFIPQLRIAMDAFSKQQQNFNEAVFEQATRISRDRKQHKL